ncbi:MAG TPA: OmpA family protein [Salinivirgaceae bacterium]|nr:OmpA family protein [Salinivirgaceae bacterium]
MSICLIFVAESTYGQNYVSKIPISQKAFEQGKNFYQIGAYSLALEQLQKAVYYDRNHFDAYMVMAQCYQEMDSIPQQINAINNAISINANLFPPVYILRAEANYLLGEYESANNDIEYFKKQFNESYQENRKHVDPLAEKVSFALNAVRNPVDIELVSLPSQINTFRDEYWPSFTVDNSQFFFTRQVKLSKDRFREDIWKCEVNQSVFGVPQPLSEIVNTNDNEGAAFVSPDGRYVLFTGCNRSDGFGSCDIYLTVNKNGEWKQPKNLGPIVNTRHWESRPVISSDGRTLYFSSNRPGGYGKTDIYKSQLMGYDTEGFPVWGAPQNLGPEINSEGREMSPFIHPDNVTLYFSSDYHTGMGRYDIFKSVYKNGKWTKPVNLGYPINTHGDETGIFVQCDGKTAFIAKSTGNPSQVDIYQFELPQSARAMAATYAKGKVIDKETKLPIEATIEVFQVNDTNAPITVMSDKKGEFLIPMTSGKRYGMNIEKTGYLFYSKHFQIDSIDVEAYQMIVELESIDKGKVLILNNVFFEFDSHFLSQESQIELNKLVDFLNQNPGVKIEIGGHTDNKGEASYNQNLSENRAKAVLNYLVQNKISKERLTYKGYGDTNPVADNKTEEGRALNRRTEIKITDR